MSFTILREIGWSLLSSSAAVLISMVTVASLIGQYLFSMQCVLKGLYA